MQCFNLTVANIMNEHDSKESFWTEINTKKTQSMLSNSSIVFLDSPNKGVIGSQLNRIYRENRLFSE